MVIDRICFSISILMVIGLITYWPECVEDMIQFATLSKENCYYSTIILENINKELFDLNISHKTLLRIKDNLIYKKLLIQEFIFLILTNVNNQDNLNEMDKKINSQLFNHSLKLLQAWIKLDLNVLKIPLLAQTLLNFINSENIQNISEIFSDSIAFSLNAKFYSNNEEYDLENLISKSDKQELESIQSLIEMIKNLLINLNQIRSDSIRNLNLEELQIVNGIANIFSSIMENYIFLIFIKNELSQTVVEILFYFISHKNRKISYKFFETLNEMREFINRGYKFYSYSDEEKLQFCNFLIKICESVMLNSKLKKFVTLNFQNLKKDILFIEDISSLQTPSDEFNDDDYDTQGISVIDYRKNAEDIFYNIFLIFSYNFHEPGAEFFFNWINKILTDIDINSESIISDNNRLLVVEVVLLVMKSVLDSFEVTEISPKYIINFCGLLLNSKILQNENFVISFILFLDQASPFIAKDTNLFLSLVQFLLNISKIKILESVATYVLLEISDFLKFPHVESFSIIYKLYSENYDLFSPQSLINVCDTLSNVVGILDKDNNNLIGSTNEELISYFSAILQPATERIHKTYEYLIALINGNISEFDVDQNKLKIEFMKNYNVFHSVLKKSYFLNNIILKHIFDYYMRELFLVTDTILKYFVKDSNFIKEISKTYVKVVHHLGEEMGEYFEKINELMLNAYINNCDNYPCLVVLKFLYSEVAKDKEKKDYISVNFIKLCDIISKNILIMKKNQIDLLDNFSQLFVKVLDTVNYLYLNQEIFNNCIALFLDALKSISEPSMNKNVIRVLSRIISDTHIIQKEISSPKFQDIIVGIFYNLDHYESSSIQDV